MTIAPVTSSFDERPDHGLVVLRASRLEALLDPLRDLLRTTRPDSVLAAQTVVAAHPGMRQWLLAALARREGPSGVVANLEVALPSAWIDTLALQLLGRPAVSLPRYQRANLRWAIFAALTDSAAVRLDAGLLETYLGRSTDAAERGRRWFQLADRLAGLYSKYLVYRPDWLQAWEAGRSVLPAATVGAGHRLEAGLLAPLWRRLAADLGSHRAGLLRRLHAQLCGRGEALPPLHVFGISHMAPSELALLRAYARSAPVLLYVPDPCREYWGGLVVSGDAAAWAQYREAEMQRVEAAAEDPCWTPQVHPLLARWGRLGQHFFSALADGEVREDIRHHDDTQAIVPGNRLARLQESIRQLRPELMHENPDPTSAGINDASLRVHACHTRVRELEVLRDALLDAIEHEQIHAADIVVMAPDIGRYAPLIPAVFGAPGSRRERLLPYHLADAPVGRGHHLFTWVRRLLALAGGRIGAPLVLDLLDVAEVRQALALDPEAAQSLREWLRQSNVAWALDRDDRTRLGVPAISEHTFAWAMDRLLTGYVLGDPESADADRCTVLADGTELLPIAGVHGPSAAALGALDRLLQALQAWQSMAGASQSAREWAQRLLQQIEALFRVAGDGETGWAALVELRRALVELPQETAAVGSDPQLPFAVVREWLEARLAQVPERQPFLLGGVTFCGMVPQRAIPFALIAVLGLDEGVFPRRQHDAGLDPMTRLRRLGDRDAQSDDRYLFLETLMSARKRLHLSYLGEGVADGKPRNPAAPLAELLAALDDAAGIAADDTTSDRPWLIRHPLQPFSARYFAGDDPRLFTYREVYATAHADGGRLPPVFRSATAPSPLPDALALDALKAFFRDPAAELLERRLHLRMEALDDRRLAEVEPLDARAEAIHTLARRQFFAQLGEAFVESEAPPAMPAELRLSGLLASGRLGERAWSREARSIAALFAELRERNWLDPDDVPRACTRSVDLLVPIGAGSQCRVYGQIEHVYPLRVDGAEGWQLLRVFPGSAGKSPGVKAESDLHLGERIPLFLEWALLRLGTPADQALRLHPLLAGSAPWRDGWSAWDADFVAADPPRREVLHGELVARIANLVRFYHDAAAAPPWYFPRSSQAALRGRAVEEVWAGGALRTGERDFGFGYGRLLAGDTRFAADAPETAALLAVATQLERWLQPEPLAPGDAG